MPITCPRCGSDNRDNASNCINCGAPLAAATYPERVAPPQPMQQVVYQKACINCNRMINANLAVCPYCGSSQFLAAQQHNKVVAGILAIFLGGLGAHKFYLGQTMQGILYLIFCWTFIPEILGIIEGIGYLTMSDYNFYQKYR